MRREKFKLDILHILLILLKYVIPCFFISTSINSVFKSQKSTDHFIELSMPTTRHNLLIFFLFYTNTSMNPLINQTK